MQHLGVVKRLYMEVCPPAAVRVSHPQRIAPIPRIEWDFYDFPWGESQVWGSNRAKRTQFRPVAGSRRRKLCKTKPNLGRLGHIDKGGCRAGCGAAGERNVQNEANLRLEARDCGLRVRTADWKTPVAGGHRRSNARNEANLARPEDKCAKRTQFPAGRMGRGPPGVGQASNVQNEPKFARAPGSGRGPAQPRCRAGERLCETKPIREANPPPNAGRTLEARDESECS
jgi:hypothetical protein